MSQAERMSKFVQRNRTNIGKGGIFLRIGIVVAVVWTVPDSRCIGPGRQRQPNLIFDSRIREQGIEVRIERVGDGRDIPMQMVVGVGQDIRERLVWRKL